MKFIKYLWSTLKALFLCAETWYEKIWLCSLLIALISELPCFIWMNITEMDVVWRIIITGGLIAITTVWVLIIGLLIQDYSENK